MYNIPIFFTRNIPYSSPFLSTISILVIGSHFVKLICYDNNKLRRSRCIQIFL